MCRSFTSRCGSEQLWHNCEKKGIDALGTGLLMGTTVSPRAFDPLGLAQAEAGSIQNIQNLLCKASYAPTKLRTVERLPGTKHSRHTHAKHTKCGKLREDFQGGLRSVARCTGSLPVSFQAFRKPPVPQPLHIGQPLHFKNTCLMCCMYSNTRCDNV